VSRRGLVRDARITIDACRRRCRKIAGSFANDENC